MVREFLRQQFPEIHLNNGIYGIYRILTVFSVFLGQMSLAGERTTEIPQKTQENHDIEDELACLSRDH